MLSVEKMNPGIQLTAKGNIVTDNFFQNPQSKDQVSDFLMNVLTRLIELSNQSSTESHGESVDLNQTAKESKDSNSVDTGTKENLTDNKASVCPSISLALGTPDPSWVILSETETSLEEKAAQQSDQGPTGSLSLKKGIVVEGTISSKEEITLVQGNPVLNDQGQKLLLPLDLYPGDGTYIMTQESEVSQSALMNPNKQSPTEGLALEGFPKQQDGFINETGYTLRVNRGGQPLLSSAQFLVDGISVQTQEPEESKSDLMNPNKQTSDIGVILKGSPKQGKGFIAETSNTLRVNRGGSPVWSSAQFLVDGISDKAQEPEASQSALMNSNKQSLTEGLALEESPKQEEGFIPGTGRTVLVNRGGQPVLSSARFLVDEIPDLTQNQNEDNSSLKLINNQVAVEEGIFQEPSENTEKSNLTWEGPLPENILKRFAAIVAQTLIDGTSGKAVTTREKDSNFKKLLEQNSENVAFKGEILPNEFIKIKIQDTRDRQSVTSFEIDKKEGQPLVRDNEKQKGVDPVFKDESLNDQKNIISIKDQESLGKVPEREGVNDNELPQQSEVLKKKDSGPIQFSQTNLTGVAFGDSMAKGKNIQDDKVNRFDPLQRFSEVEFSKDQHFLVKKQDSSSLEIVLEPAGLGKLDIELNLTNDRLYGQITVNDSLGKGLIEKNLPQLLSELVSEGLQIGGFNVSLKNHGRDQNLDKSRNEFKEPSLAKLVPERIIPVQGDHLIHIII